MNKKTILLLPSALAATILTLQAQTAANPALVVPAPPADTYVITPAYVSNYMFRGQRLCGPAFEPNLEYDRGSLGVGVWMNIPISSKVPGVSDPEIDPYAYYTINVNEALSVVPGITIYTYPRAVGANGFYGTTVEPNLALNYTVAGLKLTPKLYYDFVLQGPTAELTAGFAVPLPDAGTELDLTGQYGEYYFGDSAKNASPRVKAWGNYWLVGFSVPYQFGKTKLIMGYAYAKGGDAFTKQNGVPKAANTLAVGRSVLSASLSWTF
ncbi:MAG: hypothetical protein EXS39_07225 [Opitutaceae bacterium]|nr:hypothetical protein [Opitutaceae bacterium]